MHMADALISPATGCVMWAVSASAAAYSLKKLKDDEDRLIKQTPLMGVMGAFVFAAQMVNFAIPGAGSSGHICGALLLSAMLGKYAGFLTLSVILCIQALFFADGGLLALGCNIFNIGFINCFVAYPLIFKPIVKTVSSKRLFTASVTASVAGLQLGAFAVVLETMLSGITELPFGVFLLLMQPIHLFIGLFEGLITAGLLIFLNSRAPETITDLYGEEKPASLRAAVMIMAGAVGVGGVLALFASNNPDGLEWSVLKVLEGREILPEGFVYETASKIQEKTSVMPDYSLKSGELLYGTSIAGITGGIITFIIICLLCLLVAGKKRRLRGKP